MIGEVRTSLAALKAAAAAPATQRCLELTAPPGGKGATAPGAPAKLLIRQLMVRDGPTPTQQLCGESGKEGGCLLPAACALPVMLARPSWPAASSSKGRPALQPQTPRTGPPLPAAGCISACTGQE